MQYHQLVICSSATAYHQSRFRPNEAARQRATGSSQGSGAPPLFRRAALPPRLFQAGSTGPSCCRRALSSLFPFPIPGRALPVSRRSFSCKSLVQAHTQQAAPGATRTRGSPGVPPSQLPARARPARAAGRPIRRSSGGNRAIDVRARPRGAIYENWREGSFGRFWGLGVGFSARRRCNGPAGGRPTPAHGRRPRLGPVRVQKKPDGAVLQRRIAAPGGDPANIAQDCGAAPVAGPGRGRPGQRGPYAKPSVRRKPGQARPCLPLAPPAAGQGQAPPSQAVPSKMAWPQAKPGQARPGQAEPSRAKPSRARPSQAKPN